jgi:putative membrane protein
MIDKPEGPARTPRSIALEEAASAAARGPRAFVLDEGPEVGSTRRARAKVEIEEGPDPDFAALEPQPMPVGREPLFTGSSLVWAAFWLVITLYLADGAYDFVLSLGQKSPLVAQAAMGLIGIVVLGVLAFLTRELFSLLRMRRVAIFCERGAAMALKPNKAAVRALAGDLRDFYARDPASAAGRAEVTRVLDELHDPTTMLVIAERALLASKDAAARRVIAEAAQRVSVVTALSPRALVDILFVLAQSVSLIRKLSSIYGGRASGYGLLKLTGRVVSHLAVTGGVAMADSFVSQIVGTGLAARLSAKLGEGVLNGVLTARVGIAAAGLCRPLPFIEMQPIALSEVVKNTLMQD